MIDDQYLDTIADSEDQRPAIPPSPNLTPDRMRRDPGPVGGYSSLRFL